MVVVENEKIIETYSKQFKSKTTNNEMELKAILWSMCKYGKSNPKAIVYSDSSYCLNIFNNWMFNWKANNWKKSDGQTPENLELIKAYYDLYEKGFRLDLRKVKAHNGHYYNELADALASNNKRKISQLLE